MFYWNTRTYKLGMALTSWVQTCLMGLVLLSLALDLITAAFAFLSAQATCLIIGIAVTESIKADHPLPE